MLLLCIAESGLSETVLKVYEAMNSLLTAFFERVSVYYVHVVIGRLFTSICVTVPLSECWGTGLCH